MVREPGGIPFDNIRLHSPLAYSVSFIPVKLCDLIKGKITRNILWKLFYKIFAIWRKLSLAYPCHGCEYQQTQEWENNKLIYRCHNSLYIFQ